MKRCVIFGAAPNTDVRGVQVDPGALVLCADGGLYFARQLGLTPDLLLGDFDSCPPALANGLPHVTFPVRKDDTDLMLAVRYGIQAGCQDFTIYGALGGRLDHTLAAISVLGFLLDRGLSGRLVNGKTCVQLLGCGEHRLSSTGGYLSLFPFGCDQVSVLLSGTTYDGAVQLTASFPLGVSNEFAAKTARITVLPGEGECRVLAVICEKDTPKTPA